MKMVVFVFLLKVWNFGIGKFGISKKHLRMGICQKKKPTFAIEKTFTKFNCKIPNCKKINNSQPFPLLGFFQVEEEGVPETWASTTLVKWIRSLNMSFSKSCLVCLVWFFQKRFGSLCSPLYTSINVCIDCIDYRGWGSIYIHICQKRLEEITLDF